MFTHTEDRRKKKIVWEVVDVQEAYVFITSDPGNRDDFKAGIELRGHDVIVREVKA